MIYKYNHLKKNYLIVWFSFILIISFFVFFIGYTKNNENENSAFFGGKIKNPKSEYVYFYKGEKVLDSAKLNAQNKFAFHFDNIEPGLYTFKNGIEFQYLYLEPQDSLLISLNTWDFDKSILFSGKGGAKNNFLINLYLQQERNGKLFKYNYKLNEEEFNKAIEAEVNKLIQLYDKLIEEEGEQPSELFDKIAKTGIYYPFYYFKEFYPLHHKSAINSRTFPILSDKFYEFRNNIDLNDASLLGYGPYLTYVKTYLYHMAFEEKRRNPEKNSLELNFMEIVNEKIHIERVKNDFLAMGTWKSLTQTDLKEQHLEEIKQFFFTHCTDTTMISDIKKSIKQKERLKSGNPLPTILVTNTDGNELVVNKFGENQFIAIFFWPKDIKNTEKITKQLNYLEKKFPEILFLGIEKNKSHEEWSSFITSNKLSKNNQFKLSKNCENYDLFDDEMALTILVNKHGNIQNGYLFFNDRAIDNHLKNLINSNL